jgi:hypothetical protein
MPSSPGGYPYYLNERNRLGDVVSHRSADRNYWELVNSGFALVYLGIAFPQEEEGSTHMKVDHSVCLGVCVGLL